MREVKYLIILERGDEIPSKAMDMYKNVDMYLNYSQNLDLVVSWYNKIVETSTDTIAALIRPEMESIDVTLKEAEVSLNWNSSCKLR